MTTIDFAVVGVYFLIIVGIVWWSSRMQDTTADYFLAGRNVGRFVVGASILASNIGSGTGRASSPRPAPPSSSSASSR